MSRRQADALGRETAVAVIGAGTMGSGIAAVAALAGHRVWLHDANAAALERGMALISQELHKRIEKGRLAEHLAEAALDRIAPAVTVEKLGSSGLVIEAVVEDLELKAALLRRIEGVVREDAIIATNTSSLSITEIAARLERPERLVGMHFFNPAMQLPLVEVVTGCVTAPHVAETVYETARAWGKSPVYCASTPGFIVNRVARPFYGEALRLLQDGAADVATLDAILREAGGFRMGAFELMDMIGHDVNYAVTCSVFAAMYQDPRYKPSTLQKELVDARWLGRKSGRGFYLYGKNAVPPEAEAAAPAPRPQEVVVEGNLGPAAPMADMAEVAGIRVTRVQGRGLLRVDGRALALTDGRTAAERSREYGEPVALFDLALDYWKCKRVAIALPDGAPGDLAEKAAGLFQALGKTVSVIDDAPGLVVMRTLAMIVNEAAELVHQRVTSADDVELAMRNGANYPLGPLEWADNVGPSTLRTVLHHLNQFYGDGRYRVSPLLTRLVLANRSFGDCRP